MTIDVKVGILKIIEVPTTLYRSGSWVLNVRERRMEVLNMKFMKIL